ncbi:MAG: tetratricopeptide repeat protein [Spirochaetota bacterium]
MKDLRIAIRQRRALNCFVSGDYGVALKHFLAIERIRPDYPGLNHNLGLVAMGRGDYAEAERRFLSDLERLGDHYPRLRVLADLYYIQGRREEALAFYRRAQADEGSACATRLLAERIAICEDPERYERARHSAERYREGNTLEAAGETQAAAERYREAIEHDPTNIPAINNLGAILMNTRHDYDGAARLFEQGLAWEHLDWLAANLEKAHSGRVQRERRDRQRGGR